MNFSKSLLLKILLSVNSHTIADAPVLIPLLKLNQAQQTIDIR